MPVADESKRVKIRLSEEHTKAVRRLAAKNHRTLTAEVELALGTHILLLGNGKGKKRK